MTLNHLVSFLSQLTQTLLVVLIAPLMLGWVAQCRAWLQNRSGPGLLQPYRVLLKLLDKDVLLAQNASALAPGLFSYSRITLGPRITISPVAPVGTVFPSRLAMRISGPADGPTVPGLRCPGGSAFDAIWCAASVMPYASMIGTPNTDSTSVITRVGKGDPQRLGETVGV